MIANEYNHETSSQLSLSEECQSPTILRHKPVPQNRKFNLPKTTDDIVENNLPRLLRSFGGLTILAAVTIYLFQGNQNESEYFRYFILLGHSVGLALLGFFCGKTLSDSKGARTFIALSLASVPANFAILGGFIRSQFLYLDNVGTAIPESLTWSADSLIGALLSTGATMLLLSPVIYIGFLTLCRPIASKFTGLFILMNTAILLPLRAPIFISLLVTILVALLAKQIHQYRNSDLRQNTFEDGIAQLILLSPLAVIIGRSLWIYGFDSLLLITMIGLVLGFLRFAQQGSSWLALNRGIEAFRFILSIQFSASAAELIGIDLLNNTTLVIMIFGATLLGLMWDLSRTSSIEKKTHAYVGFVTWGWAILIATNLFFKSTVISPVSAVFVGIIMLIYAIRIHSIHAKLGGAALLTAGIICQVLYIIDNFSLGSWNSLGVLGVTAILVSTLIEKQDGRLQWLLNKIEK